jgi:hypothetical protein
MADIKGPKQQNSNSPSAHDNSTRIFPAYLLWFVVIPVLPFFFSMATLSFFINPTLDSKEIFVIVKQLLANDSIIFIDQPVKTLIHVSDLLTYLSITSVHAIVCLIVIGFFLYQTHQLPKDLIKRTYLYMAITTVTLLVFAYVIHLYANNLMLIQLGYKSICVLLGMADLQTSLVWPDSGMDGVNTGEACFRSEFTRLVWLAYTPVMLGMLAMLSASAFTTVMASEPIPSADERWRPHFLARVKILQKSFYLLSLVLVTSTVTILLFTSLPLDLLADGILKTAFNKFINGITAFWGGLFTATLFAAFAPAVFLFIKQTLNHQKGLTAPSDLGEWLHESVFVSIKKQAMNTLMMIAPMLVGPLGSLLQKLSS